MYARKGVYITFECEKGVGVSGIFIFVWGKGGGAYYKFVCAERGVYISGVGKGCGYIRNMECMGKGRGGY